MHQARIVKRCDNRSVSLFLLLILFAGLVHFECASGFAADQQVVAVIACDGYSSLKKQVAWCGKQIDNPGLAGVMESALAFATNGKGLAGLDPLRPVGLVLTTDGSKMSAHAYVPVKEFERLLMVIQGVYGQIQKEGKVYRLNLKNGGVVQIIEKKRWAILSMAGMDSSENLDPTVLFTPLIKEFTVAAEIFPSRVPESLRVQFTKLLQQASNSDPQKTIVPEIPEEFFQAESITLGLGIDEEKNRVKIESRTVASDGSAMASSISEMNTATSTVPLNLLEKPAVRLVVAQSIPPLAAQAILGALLESTAPATDTQPVEGKALDVGNVGQILQGLATAALRSIVDSGQLDIAAACATSQEPLEFIAGMRIGDGRALEESIAKLLAPEQNLPKELGVALNSGKVGDANLHTITIAPSSSESDSLFAPAVPRVELTIAVTPKYAFVLCTKDPQARLEELLEKTGNPDSDSKLGISLQLDMHQILSYVSKYQEQQVSFPLSRQGSAKDKAILQLLVRPIPRGVGWQISADSGALRSAMMLAPLVGQFASSQNSSGGTGVLGAMQPPGIGLPHQLGGPPGAVIPGFGPLGGSLPPGSTLPGSTLPGSTLPGSTLPGSTPPGSTPPGSTPPGSTPPSSTLPGSTPPGSTPPSSTLPGSTLPGSTLPGSTLPGSTLPGSTLPGSLPPAPRPGVPLPSVQNAK